MLGILRRSSILGSKVGPKNLTFMLSISLASLCCLVQGSLSQSCLSSNVMPSQFYVTCYTIYKITFENVIFSRIILMYVQINVIFFRDIKISN
jgi:hypothetical protein